MALYEAFEVFGHLELKKDTLYTTTDIPATMDVLALVDSGFIYGKKLDEKGDPVLVKKIPQYGRTDIRGVRYKVVNSTVTYSVDHPNVLGIWQVGEQLVFNSDSTYEFFNVGTIAYGKKVSV